MNTGLVEKWQAQASYTRGVAARLGNSRTDSYENEGRIDALLTKAETLEICAKDLLEVINAGS